MSFSLGRHRPWRVIEVRWMTEDTCLDAREAADSNYIVSRRNLPVVGDPRVDAAVS
jgi:hypothetical protein